MNDVTRVLSAIEHGDANAAEALLPLVYVELRRLAARRLAQEQPGQTIQATALVHEAYVRLVEGGASQGWNSRGHFFAAAAEAMRRNLESIGVSLDPGPGDELADAVDAAPQDESESP